MWHLALLAVFAQVSGTATPLYLQPGAPINDRVADLVSQMNLDEKIAQLSLPFGAKFPEDYVKYNETGLGATYPIPSEYRNEWQRYQTTGTRLKIPTSFIGETLHSGASKGTIFPHESLQGCMWAPDLVEAAAKVIALEASANGVDRGFSPVLHMCTDPRFGRCEEAFSEDPAVVAANGVAAVTGLQGPGAAGAASTYLEDPTTQIATEAKHFGAYGFSGRDSSMPAELSENTLFDVYMRPWKAFAQAGGRGIMAAHNEVRGMPCHANGVMLGALRNLFGFGDGLCASDAGDINHITAYGVAADSMHAAALAINAGMDQELQKDGAFEQLPEALKAGLVNQTTIDRAVGNVLRQKFASGLFDGREELLYVNQTRLDAVLDLPSSRLLARQMAEEGITLLANPAAPGRGPMLPLAGLGDGIKTIAVLGPNADNALSTRGGYTATGADVVTILDGAIAAANASGNAFQILYERGACLGGTPDCDCSIPADPTVPPCEIRNTSRIGLAVDLATQADVTVLVLGDSSTLLAGDPKLHHETATCGEHFDRDDFDPAGAQLELLRKVSAATANLIVVLIHGRQVTFGQSYTDGRNALFSDGTAAYLSAWRPGEEAGNAVWRIINGTVNPSGRTAHTWPRSSGQVHQYVPWYLERGTRKRSQAYADMAKATPLVPFGWGLSYSNYSISDVQFPSGKLEANATFQVELTAKSEGPAGKVVVQVYYSPTITKRVRFGTMLLGWTKVAVPENGKVKGVKIQLRVADMEAWDSEQGRYVVESGDYNIKVGLSSVDSKMFVGKITVA